MLDEQSEMLRLASAEEIMYGNKDKDKTFPIDASSRLTHYTIYIERKKWNDEVGEMVSLKTSRRYQQPTIKTFEDRFESTKFFERFKGLVLTILHDPKEQARIEGVEVLSGKATDVSKLRQMLGKAKTAGEFSKPATKKGGGNA